MNQKTKTIFMVLTLCLLSMDRGECQTLISAKTDSLIKKGIRLSLKQSYSEANAIFSGLQIKEPNNPIGYFFQAAVLHMRMMDYENYDTEEEFLSLLKITIQLSQKRLSNPDADPWNSFFLGGAYGYLALHLGKQNRILEAFKIGRNSIKALEAIHNDQHIYDVYLGLGTYKYYRSKLSRYFTWLPFVKDERAEGIEMIKIAMKRSRYSRYGALSSLCWIFIEENDFHEAYDHVMLGLHEFPDSRGLLWVAAEAAKGLELWQEAAHHYKKIMNSLAKEDALFAYNETICRLNLADIYLTLGDEQEADRHCQELVYLELTREEEHRLPKNLKKIEKTCHTRIDKTAVLSTSQTSGEPR